MGNKYRKIEAVRETLADYIGGTRDGDIQRVKCAFHPDAVMHGHMQGMRVSGTPKPFFDDVANGPSQIDADSGYSATIQSIEVYGSAATAVIIEENISVGLPDGSRTILDIMDFFHLVEENGRWLIVSKLFNHD